MVNFDVCKKAQKLIAYHSNVSSSTAKIISSFIICIHEPINAEKLVKFGPVLAEIFGMICRFLPSLTKKVCLHKLPASSLGLVDRF